MISMLDPLIYNIVGSEEGIQLIHIYDGDKSSSNE